MLKKEKTYYFPVSITLPQNWNVAEHWYKSNPYFYYGNVFTSPFVTGIRTSRKKDFPESEYVIADSGGYQFVTGTNPPKIGVLDILRWQENIADVAFTLDLPAYSYQPEVDGYRYYTEKYFQKCMDFSNKNAWLMLESQQNKKMQLWGIVQGGNGYDQKRWYDALTKEHTFPGYAFPMASTFNPRAKDDWISQLQFAKSINTNFHFLGRSEPLLVLVYAKLAQKTKKIYTYDTASAAMGLMQGKYTEPYFLSSLNFTKINIKDRVKFDENDHPPCDCPVCKKHTIKEVIETYGLLLLHNVYVRVKWNDYCNVVVKDDDVFNDIVNKLLRLHPIYKKSVESYKEGINSLIFDETKNQLSVESFF